MREINKQRRPPNSKWWQDSESLLLCPVSPRLKNFVVGAMQHGTVGRFGGGRASVDGPSAQPNCVRAQPLRMVSVIIELDRAGAIARGSRPAEIRAHRRSELT